jgi:hypothetical protein
MWTTSLHEGRKRLIVHVDLECVNAPALGRTYLPIDGGKGCSRQEYVNGTQLLVTYPVWKGSCR